MAPKDRLSLGPDISWRGKWYYPNYVDRLSTEPCPDFRVGFLTKGCLESLRVALPSSPRTRTLLSMKGAAVARGNLIWPSAEGISPRSFRGRARTPRHFAHQQPRLQSLVVVRPRTTFQFSKTIPATLDWAITPTRFALVAVSVRRSAS
jgi:hypothetical protein